jgi:ribosomal protein S26
MKQDKQCTYRVIKKASVHLMITVQKQAKVFYTISITYHDNVVRIRDNRWR